MGDGRAAQVKRNHEAVLAFARKRIAEDHRNHRPVSLQKIATEYEAQTFREQQTSTITVGNAP
jgi:hypothetical protein